MFSSHLIEQGSEWVLYFIGSKKFTGIIDQLTASVPEKSK